MPVDVFDPAGLMLNILIHIIRIQTCSLFFYPAIFLYRFFVGTKIISERQMSLEFRRILGTNIQVMFQKMGFAVILESFAAPYAQVAFMPVSY